MTKKASTRGITYIGQDVQSGKEYVRRLSAAKTQDF